MATSTEHPSCAERVADSRDSRLGELRMMLQPEHDDVELLDDGTMDTVLRIDDQEFRYSDSSDYRDPDTGAINLEEFVEANFDDMRETMYEQFNEYGLCFDYVAPGTFTDQEQGYFRYQISWGGPSEEIRFFVNPDFSVYHVEFWFLDWWDGASLTLRGTDRGVADMVWQQFSEGCDLSAMVKSESDG